MYIIIIIIIKKTLIYLLFSFLLLALDICLTYLPTLPTQYTYTYLTLYN